MTFIWPWALLSLLLIPVGLLTYRRLLQDRQRTVVELGSMGLAVNRTGQGLGHRRHVPPAFYLGGLFLLLVGFARPEANVSLPRVEGTVILAFDVSNSMLADDFEPSRMEAAKAAAKSFVENQPPTILIGIVAFSNGGLVITPPTGDQAEVMAAIDRLSPQGGTSLGQGIFTSLNAIAGQPIDLGRGLDDPANLDPEDLASFEIGYFPSAVVVLLSDGENTASPDPLAISQLAAEAGVRIFPIGIGSPQGTVIEVDGFQIVTQLNEAILQDIASLTNGSYFLAIDEQSLQQVYEKIDLQLTIRGEKTEVTSLFAAGGFLLFIVGLFLAMKYLGRMP